jgi:diazepam-binding inhibitor (GABA receptor modulating acyl-CoA-binding protein)
MSNSQEFLIAAETVKKLSQKPNNDELKVLYGFYKQAVVGDCNTEKPGMFDFKEKAKWDSWNSNKGMSKHDSEVQYILYVNQLIQKYGVSN